MRYGHRAKFDDYATKFQRCSACGSNNRVGRTVGGGIYTPSTTVIYTDPHTGKNFYQDSAEANGCWFCGSPRWQSDGRLGDAARAFK